MDDLESDWTYSKTFDYIHSRLIVLGTRDWNKVFRQSFEHLKPGGWVEYQEGILKVFCEDPTAKETHFQSISDDIHEAGQKIGVDSRCPAHASFGEGIKKAGFVNHQMITFRWPIGEWPEDEKERKIGPWAKRNLLHGVPAASLAFLTRIAGLSREEVEMRSAHLKNEFNDPSVHQYIMM